MRVQRPRPTVVRDRRGRLAELRLDSRAGPAKCASWSTRARSRRGRPPRRRRGPPAPRAQGLLQPRARRARLDVLGALCVARALPPGRRHGHRLRSGAAASSRPAGSRSRRSRPADTAATAKPRRGARRPSPRPSRAAAWAPPGQRARSSRATASTGICHIQSKVAVRQKATQPASAAASIGRSRDRPPESRLRAPPTRTTSRNAASRASADDPKLAEGLHVEGVGVPDGVRAGRCRASTRTRRCPGPVPVSGSLRSAQPQRSRTGSDSGRRSWSAGRSRPRDRPPCLNSAQASEARPGASRAASANQHDDHSGIAATVA